MKIKKGDTVLIISGKDRQKQAKVLDVFPSAGKLIVEGINLKKKHAKPKRSGEKGQIVEKPAAFPASKVKLVCPKCGKPSRVGYKVAGDKKYRVCKKCQAEI
jgi:large subunit ribosomal protein L24